jgi:outer membrane protein assembly factor BamB
MSRTAPHFLARVALLLLLAPHLAGCYTTRAVAYNPNSLKDATGVTMRSGSTIMFEDGGASISDDTIYARGRDGQLKLPSDSVSSVWHRNFAPVKSGAVIVGLALVGVFIAAAASLENGSFFGSP